MNEKVTIVTPTWNSERYILDTIKSVQAQTYSYWEMIIVDDCSTDRTIEIIQKVADEDGRIRLLRQDKTWGRLGLEQGLCRKALEDM